MRCPYCQGLNSERARYCVHCGRDMTAVPQQQPRQAQPVQGYSTPAPAQRPPSSQPSRSGAQAPTQGRLIAEQPAAPPRVRQQEPVAAPPAPEAPAPFPPRKLAELQALAQSALPFTVAETQTPAGRKKIVRIVYPKCVGWQQAATLLKAFNEQQEAKFDTIIIQGFHQQDAGGYAFTNGQLSFDRNVRLGSQTMNRYQVETGNGFESDSVRIVLSE